MSWFRKEPEVVVFTPQPGSVYVVENIVVNDCVQTKSFKALLEYLKTNFNVTCSITVLAGRDAVYVGSGTLEPTPGSLPEGYPLLATLAHSNLGSISCSIETDESDRILLTRY